MNALKRLGIAALFASTTLGSLLGGEMSGYKWWPIALGALVGVFLTGAIAQIFVAGVTPLFRFTLDDEINREIYEGSVIPTAKALLFLTAAACIVALVIRIRG